MTDHAGFWRTGLGGTVVYGGLIPPRYRCTYWRTVGIESIQGVLQPMIAKLGELEGLQPAQHKACFDVRMASPR